jgi:hypothetical protein
MRDEFDYREKLRSKIRWVFLVGMLCGGMMFGLCLYYWDTAPAVPDVASGRVIPQFDKLHDRFVYLTKMQDHGIFIFLLLAAICTGYCVILGLVLERSEARSKQQLDRSQD